MKKRSFICTLLAALTLTFPFVTGCGENNSYSSESSAGTAVISQSETQSLPSEPVSEEPKPEESSAVSSVTDESSAEASKTAESSTETSKSESSGITPAVWKAENSDGNYIYMMGSIHFGDEATKYMPDYVDEAFNYSDALAVEADVEDVMNDTSKIMELVYKLMYVDGTTIKDHISKETYDGIVDLLNQYNSYSPLYDYYVPYFWQTLLTNLTLQDSGLTSQNGVDMVLLERAKKENKDVYEIESLNYQIDMLTSFSDGLNEMILKNYLKPGAIEAERESTKQLYEYWKKGTIDAALLLAENLEKSSSNTDEETEKYNKEYNDKVLTQRNIGMAKKAESYIDNGEKVFVLVGAMHFYGDEGILKLMTKDGYKVSLVK